MLLAVQAWMAGQDTGQETPYRGELAFLLADLRAGLDAALVTALATSGRMGEGCEDVVPTLMGGLIWKNLLLSE
jgi:hypothetical protein